MTVRFRDLILRDDAPAVVHPAAAGVSDTARTAASLENHSFVSPAGQATIRGTGHLVLAPACALHLVEATE
jgi:hypothetical protein